jgi:hypothetical protein
MTANDACWSSVTLRFALPSGEGGDMGRKSRACFAGIAFVLLLAGLGESVDAQSADAREPGLAAYEADRDTILDLLEDYEVGNLSIARTKALRFIARRGRSDAALVAHAIVGILARDGRRWGEARGAFEAIARSSSEPARTASARYQIAMLDLREGKPERAIEQVLAAHRAFADAGEPDSRMETWASLLPSCFARVTRGGAMTIAAMEATLTTVGFDEAARLRALEVTAQRFASGLLWSRAIEVQREVARRSPQSARCASVTAIVRFASFDGTPLAPGELALVASCSVKVPTPVRAPSAQLVAAVSTVRDDLEGCVDAARTRRSTFTIPLTIALAAHLPRFRATGDNDLDSCLAGIVETNFSEDDGPYVSPVERYFEPDSEPLVRIPAYRAR